MYSIKFMMGESYNCMACNHYHVTKLDSGVFEVTMYPNYTSCDGVTYQVSSDESKCNIPHFDCAYVMNSNGDTIDTIR